MSNLIIKNRTVNALKLNESVDESGQKKYLFEGPFTICGVKNRNERIYDEEEVLKHLSYLREKIKKEGCILGELDHPEGRFEIYLQDVSHKITDLWYVPEKKTVMGRLELMPTDKGRTMMAMVDAGCPLYVSSRAAGTVGADSHVSIQQIFTYDIVATPGFEQCKLEMVSESMKNQVKSFINESINAQKKAEDGKFNKATKYGILDENVEIIETDSKIPEFDGKNTSENIDMDKLTTPLVEDIQVKVSADKAKELGLKIDGKDSEDNSEFSADDIIDIIPTYAEQDTNEIMDIQPEFQSADDAAQNTEGQTETQGAQPENNSEEENPFMMESCGNKKKKKPAKKESKKEEYSEEKDLDENNECDGKECQNKKNCKGNNCNNDNESCCECNDKTVESLKKQKKSVKESASNSIEYYQGILEERRIKMQIKQSIVEQYPFSISLSESNFDKFAQLSEDDKKACAQYIFENEIYDIRSINEQFMRPLFDKINEQKNYIRLADKSDLELYNMAPRSLKEHIDYLAKMFILETKSDVDEFWSRTGIRNMAKNNISNETFVQNYNEKMSETVQDDDFFFGIPKI